MMVNGMEGRLGGRYTTSPAAVVAAAQATAMVHEEQSIVRYIHRPCRVTLWMLPRLFARDNLLAGRLRCSARDGRSSHYQKENQRDCSLNPSPPIPARSTAEMRLRPWSLA